MSELTISVITYGSRKKEKLKNVNSRLVYMHVPIQSNRVEDPRLDAIYSIAGNLRAFSQVSVAGRLYSFTLQVLDGKRHYKVKRLQPGPLDPEPRTHH